MKDQSRACPRSRRTMRCRLRIAYRLSLGELNSRTAIGDRPHAIRVRESSSATKSAIHTDDHGFTLIELLVVVALISILAAIAVPQFSAYRQRGYDAQASSDLRNAALAQEANFATSSAYVSCSDRADCMAKLPGFAAANDTVITMTNNANASFNGSAKSALGSGATCRWDSAAAGFKGCS